MPRSWGIPAASRQTDLRLLDVLARKGAFQRVAASVSPDLEMTEIQTRLLAEGGPAVQFDRVESKDGRRWDMPVLVNLFGTVGRVARGDGARTFDARPVPQLLPIGGRQGEDGGPRPHGVGELQVGAGEHERPLALLERLGGVALHAEGEFKRFEAGFEFTQVKDAPSAHRAV